MTHNVKRSQRDKSIGLAICSKRQRRFSQRRSQRLMTTKVLKLLKMEATTKAASSDEATPSTSAAADANNQTGAEGGGGGGASSASDCADNNNSEFYNTGRVGRRNALPDILSHHSTTSTADLPDKLSALSTSDGNEGTSK